MSLSSIINWLGWAMIKYYHTVVVFAAFTHLLLNDDKRMQLNFYLWMC